MLRLRIKLSESDRTRQCPRCNSSDTWRWARDKSLFKPLAAALGRHMMTCRCCGHKFYITRKSKDHPLVKFLALFSIGVKPAPAGNLKVMANRTRTVRPARELPALKVSFAEWERNHAEAQESAALRTASGRGAR